MIRKAPPVKAELPPREASGEISSCNTEAPFSPADSAAQVGSLGLGALNFAFGNDEYLTEKVREYRRAAQDAYQASFAQYQQTVLTAFRQIADTLHALQNDADAVTAQHQAVNSATKALELNRKAYMASNSTVLQVLDAQRLLLLAELGLVEARAERLRQTVNLFVPAGGGLKASPEAQ